ncbi:MAG TPA: Ig-like domain-containing protein [Gemmatimonadales bacterium]
MSTRLATGAALVLLVACARIEPPPGGPPDTAPPRLESIAPEPLAVVPGFDGEVEFRFSEVISEGTTANLGTGMGDLERLVVLSPTTRVPEVRWRRDRITVRPREGWRPNTVYRVELLPGVSDLRNNRGVEVGGVVTFSTGGPIPTDTLRGRAWDWTTGRPAIGALVEAALLPDTLVYRFVTDSAGGFAAGPLPPGTYHVTAALDPERDRRRTGREAFDSVSVAIAEADSLELWLFPHDTTAPRLAELAVADSMAIRLRFSQMLDPGQPLDSLSVSLRALPDSAPVAVRGVVTPAEFDSLARARAAAPADTAAAGDSIPRPVDTARVAADSARAAADSARKPAAAAPMPSRLPLSDRLVLRTEAPLVTGRSYVVEIRGIRNASGVAGNATGVIEVRAPERPAAPPGAPAVSPPSDSTAAPVKK